jgi:hypothetical protein
MAETPSVTGLPDQRYWREFVPAQTARIAPARRRVAALINTGCSLGRAQLLLNLPIIAQFAAVPNRMQ